MILEPGTRLGPYTVESALGSGGMGEVYRARDTRLHRVVALKTLSGRLESNAHAIERFEREARAAASLNHPNICTIYDVGTNPPFIAMELLEGETLQQRLTRGPLDVMTAVDVMLALVDALDTAHGKSILHRDIKPANIFLTPRGPKILDFGLAKSVSTTPAAGQTGQLTVAPESLLTDQGVTVGTVAYMSPEQLRGQPLEPPSDLFSLGLVMYEMVTGQRAFGGETSAVIAAAILSETPVPPRQLQDEVPARLEDIILKTIEKDPRDRTQTAAELRADLRRFKRGVEAGSIAHGSDERSSGSAASRSALDRTHASDTSLGAESARGSRRTLVLVAVAAALALAGVGYVLWPWGSSPNASRNALLQSVQISQVTVTGNAWRPALSPDGKFVVYVRRDGLYRSLRMRQLGTDRDIEIVAAEPGVNLQAATVTPDGAYVDFLRGKGNEPTLWRVPFLGGAPKRVLDKVNSPIGWSPDGRRFAFVRAGFDGASTLVIADADGSNERTLATRTLPSQFLSFGMRGTPSAEGAAIHPAWSPDGRTLALIGFEPIDGVLTRQAVFVDVTSGSHQSIALRDAGGADGIDWLDNGQLVLSAQGENDSVAQLWVLSYPEATWSRLTNDLSNYASFGLSASRQSLAAARWDYQVGILALDGSSLEPSPVVAATPFVAPYIGWANDRLLYAVQSPADNRPAVWALPYGSESAGELVANASSPEATADGQTIVFARTENRRRGIWRATSDGRNAVEITTATAARVSLTPDAAHVIYVSNEGGRQRAWIVPIQGGSSRPVADVFAYNPAASRDGKSVAFVSVNEQNRPVIMACALSDCSLRQTFPLPRSPTALQWTPDGRGIAYSTLANIWVQPRDGGAPYQLTRFPEGEHRIEDFEWSPDGRRLAFSRSKTTWDIVLFRGVPRD
jgi:eukaryotic-like serine/threonine-protein kinase